MPGNKLIQDYAWLIAALRPYCDEVMTSVSDFDQRLSIGARWGSHQVAVLVESAEMSDGRLVWRSVNQEIAKGVRSRADVILDVLAKRPGGVPATMGAK